MARTKEAVVVDPPVEQTPAEAAASFAKGFNETPDAPAEPAKPAQAIDKQETPETPTTEEAPAAETPAAAVETEVEKPVLAGLTETQIKAMLAQIPTLEAARVNAEKQYRQVFGKLGELQRDVTARETKAPTGTKVTAESLKKLRVDFPEIADALASDLSEMNSPAGLTQEQVDAHVTKVVGERISKEVADLNAQFLSRFHKDWQDFAPGGPGKTDLDIWLTTKPAEYRDKFLESNSAPFLADGLDEFKTWRTQSQTVKQSTQSRLARAAQPKGSGAAPGTTLLSDHEAFKKGFNETS